MTEESVNKPQFRVKQPEIQSPEQKPAMRIPEVTLRPEGGSKPEFRVSIDALRELTLEEPSAPKLPADERTNSQKTEAAKGATK